MCCVEQVSILPDKQDKARVIKPPRVMYILIPAVTTPGRDGSRIEMIESYLRAVGMFRDYSNPNQDPTFSQVSVHSYAGGLRLWETACVYRYLL